MSSTSSYPARRVSDFPTYLPEYGIWWEGERFTLHKSLTAVKGAISTHACPYYHEPTIIKRDVKIYERHGDQWILIYKLPVGTDRMKHPLWAAPAPKTGVAVTDEDIASAIASITGTKPEEGS